MRILLGTDGSEGARWGADIILALPFPSPVNVTVVAVAEVPHPPFTSLTPMARQMYNSALASLRREAEEAARTAMDEARKALDGSVTSVATRLTHGPAAASLIETAEALGADLVVVGSRGFGPVKQVLLGSVSQKVVRYAPCSVLLARGPVKGIPRLLVGVDGSIYAEEATRLVAALSLPAEAALHLCTVVERPVLGPVSGRMTAEELSAALQTIAEVGRTSAERVLAAASSVLGTKGCAITSSLREGHPVDHLLGAIRELRPDLTVIGAKGRTAEKRFALGSVAQMILKYASCSVLVVRP
jgi:nucleotide-binding universal stress UspA family protein